MMSVDVPGAGGLVMGFSIWTRISALLAAWLSSLMATSSVLGSGEAMTLTGIFSLASPFSVLCLLWMFCHTVSAACLFAGDGSRFDSESSRRRGTLRRGSHNLIPSIRSAVELLVA